MRTEIEPMDPGKKIEPTAPGRLAFVSPLLLLLALLWAWFTPPSQVRPAGGQQPFPMPSLSRGNLFLPVYFERAAGASETTYWGHTNAGYRVRLSRLGIAIHLGGRSTPISLELVGATRVDPREEGRLAGLWHRFHSDDPSSWTRRGQRFAAVTYPDIYPGIDLIFRSRGTEIEFDFRITPGRRPEAIKIRLSGMDRVELDPTGLLRIQAGEAVLHLPSPDIFQPGPGGRQYVPGNFRVDRDLITFEVPNYDPERELVVDPVIHYSTFLGGIPNNLAEAVALDEDGNTYVAGSTESFPGEEFPVVDALREEGSGFEVFLAKLDPQGEVLFLTLLGGTGSEVLTGMDLDPEGNIWLTGWTTSSDFPSVDASQGLNGDSDAFVTKVNADGDQILFSTHFGGSGLEHPRSGVLQGARRCGGITSDLAGNVYVTGVTNSVDFPTLNPFQADGQEPRFSRFDAFVSSFTNAGSLRYSSYLGGDGRDLPRALDVDVGGRLFVAGETRSPDFPQNPPQLVDPDTFQQEGFLSVISADGATLVMSTLVGGLGNSDTIAGLELGREGEVYLLGDTNSPDFPVDLPPTPTGGLAARALQETLSGNSDLFLARWSADLSGLLWSGFLGGCDDEVAAALSLSSSGTIYLTGTTFSPDFPLLDPVVGEFTGQVAFVSSLDAGHALVFSSLLGGVFASEGRAIDGSGGDSIAVAGSSVAGGPPLRQFPLVNPFSTGSNAGSFDAFVIRLSNSRGLFLGSGEEWTRHLRLDSNGNGRPDPADEVIAMEQAGDRIALASSRWGSVSVELGAPDADGAYRTAEWERVRHVAGNFLEPGPVRTRRTIRVTLETTSSGVFEQARIEQTTRRFNPEDGSLRQEVTKTAVGRLLDVNQDSILDTIGFQTPASPELLVSLLPVDADGDGENDHVTVPWSLARLFGVKKTDQIADFQPFLPLSDTDGDGVNDSFAVDLNFDGVADPKFLKLPLAGPESPPREVLYFAHFGEGEGLLNSQILLFPLNGDSDVEATLDFAAPDGSPLSSDLNGTDFSGRVQVLVPACGLLVLETDGLGPIVSGSVRVTSKRPLGGVILFGGVVGVAGVPSSEELGRGFMAPLEVNLEDQVTTGVAVMNLESRSTHLIFRLLDSDGIELAVKELDLAGNGQLARFVEELFEGIDFTDFLGVLLVEAEGRVTATVLQTHPGEFVAMPVASLVHSARTLDFAHFGEGAGQLFSKFLIMNVDTKTADFSRITVRNDDGRFLETDLNGRAIRGESSLFIIPPRGIRRFATDGEGLVVSGSASAKTNNGQIAGTIVFGGNLGVAGVGASQSFSRGFLAPVIVDTESNLDTGLAFRGLVSFSPAGHFLSIELFQADGLLVARAELTVRALGHEARFLSEFEWVPEPGVELDFSRFEGLIKVRTKSRVTATVLQTRGTQFATLPTFPILD